MVFFSNLGFIWNWTFFKFRIHLKLNIQVYITLMVERKQSIYSVSSLPSRFYCNPLKPSVGPLVEHHLLVHGLLRDLLLEHHHRLWLRPRLPPPLPLPVYIFIKLTPGNFSLTCTNSCYLVWSEQRHYHKSPPAGEANETFFWSFLCQWETHAFFLLSVSFFQIVRAISQYHLIRYDHL